MRNSLQNSLKSASDWVVEYFDKLKDLPVTPNVRPGELFHQLEKDCPTEGLDIQTILEEFDQKIIPYVGHWNHPGFMAYFNSTASEPAIIAELLMAAMNSNTMNWKSSPAGSELEKLTIQWINKALGLEHEGVIFDGGSTTNFHAILCIRHYFFGAELKNSGLQRSIAPIPRFYLSDQCHHSVHKAILAAGFSYDSIIEIETDDNFAMDSSLLRQQIIDDEANSQFAPAAVIATLGSTSSCAIDPIEEILKVIKNENRNLWLHIDAAHGGMAAMHPAVRKKYKGWEQADSLTVNPHKWMFVSLDTSILFFRDKKNIKEAFSYSASYLQTDEDEQVDNYMDFGIPLGRRFKSLKLYFTMKYFGKFGLIDKIDQHLQLGADVYQFLDSEEGFELMAPLNLSTVCFRVIPHTSKITIDEYNLKFMNLLNKTGRFFLTHTKLNGKVVIRIVISSIFHTQKVITNLKEELVLIKNQMYNEYNSQKHSQTMP